MREKINFALADQTYSETLQIYEEKFYESRVLVCSVLGSILVYFLYILIVTDPVFDP